MSTHVRTSISLDFLSADDQTVNLSLMYSNRAASQLKIGDLSGCVKDCTKSLELIPHSVKPLLRRAIAYEHLERYGSTKGLRFMQQFR